MSSKNFQIFKNHQNFDSLVKWNFGSKNANFASKHIKVSVLTIHSDADFDADFESNLGPSCSKSVEFVNKELSKNTIKNTAENLGKSYSSIELGL